MAEDVVDDRQQVGEALAGAGAGAHQVGLAALGDPQGLVLVLVEAHALAEEAGRVGVDDALLCQFAQGGAGLVGGVQLQHRLRPQLAPGQLLIDESADARVEHVDERFQVVAVAVHHLVAQFKDVDRHRACLLILLWTMIALSCVVRRVDPAVRIMDNLKRKVVDLPRCGETLNAIRQ